MTQRARRRPANGGDGAAPESGGALQRIQDWLRGAQQQPGGNGAVVEEVTGQRLDEDASTSFLDMAAAETGVDSPTLDVSAGQSPATDHSEPVLERATPQSDPRTYNPRTYRRVHQRHEGRVDDLGMKIGNRQGALNSFVAHWERHQARYQFVSGKTGVPAKLIAAIHWREATGDFTRYLHQGDPLGKKARRVPRNIPIFHVWEDAAIHALNMKKNVRDDIGLTAETTDTAAIATYAEAYNGLGYHNAGRVSPYVYAGTDAYTSGKYVRDGKFSARAVDQQLGVLVMMDSLNGLDQSIGATSTSSGRARPAGGGSTHTSATSSAWNQVLTGRTVLRKGSRGKAVEQLQALLGAAGHATGVDGQFGNGTYAKVVAFQRANRLTADGIVGKATAEALQRRS